MTLWTIERYMDSMPADWPYPGSFWDISNDLTCILMIIPSDYIGRFTLGLIFFPIPILIALYRHDWFTAMLYIACTSLPNHVFLHFKGEYYGIPTHPIIVVFLFPLQIRTWAVLVKPPVEKRLMQANLIVLWLMFAAADIMYGLMGIHGNYCKLGIMHPLAQS